LWPLDEHYLILISKNWVQFILRKWVVELLL
jgi:hypothetical protein